MTHSNRQVVIVEIPKGKLALEHFKLVETSIPTPGEAQVLVRVRYIVIEPAMRAWMLGPSYRAALTAGQVMAGAALAEVIESRVADFAPGDLVYADDAGCQEYAALSAANLRKLDHADPITHLVSVYGVVGLTAYFGLLKIGNPQKGETVVVSAAAGAVGSFVGQIAKIRGCRVIGIAGGKAKCDLLTNELGFDAAVDYKAGNLYQTLVTTTQGGIDVYFDNVGGEIFEACLFNMKPHGRMVACGAVSAYDADPTKGLQTVRGVPAWFISRRLSLRGFIVSDFYAERDKALADLRGWVASGQIKVREDIIDGLEKMPSALVGLLAGENVGKRLVKVGERVFGNCLECRASSPGPEGGAHM
jgi:NADPH-dependent curcumin reductase CurA